MRASYGQTAEPPRVAGLPFRPDVEGLRAVAVLAVVAFHYGVPGFHAGFVGVDIFFVISGYLITGLLTHEMAATRGIDFARFYGRRMRRLLPALLLVTVVTLVCGTIVFSPVEQLEVAKAAAASAAYVSNVWFTVATFGYFAPESRFNPFLHTWSLSVEEQFYIVYPMLLWLTARGRPARLGWVLAAVTAASFALCLVWTKTEQPWAFFSSPARAWEFGVGGLASLVTVPKRIAALAGWAGVALLVASFFVIDEQSVFPGAVALLPVAASAMILCGGVAGPGRVLATAPFQWIGQRSYSIYLWHWPIITLAKVMRPDLPAWVCAACAVLTLVCADFSYRFVEHPIRTDAWLARPRRALSLGVSITAASLFVAFGVWASARHFMDTPAQKAIAEVTGAPAAANARGCLAGFDGSDPASCRFGHGGRTIVLFGDSHADEWSTPLAEIARRRGWTLVTFLKSLCPAADIMVYNARLRRDAPECSAWRAKAEDAIVRLHPDLVLLGEFTRTYVSGDAPSDRPVSLATWSAGLARTLGRFRTAGIAAAVLRDTPLPAMDIRFCLSRAAWHGEDAARCDTPRVHALDARIADAERRTATAANARYVDLTAQFCDPATCPAVKGVIVYRDGNHISTAFAARLAEPLATALADAPVLTLNGG
jgi:peptidoglycan/LPS O-acetylase OafA/YrhL